MSAVYLTLQGVQGRLNTFRDLLHTTQETNNIVEGRREHHVHSVKDVWSTGDKPQRDEVRVKVVWMDGGTTEARLHKSAVNRLYIRIPTGPKQHEYKCVWIEPQPATVVV